LLLDNATTHKAASVCQFFTQKSHNPLSRPFSPYLSPPDYFLFLRLKMKLKGLHFVNAAAAVTDELRQVQKEEFSAVVQRMYDRTKSCIYSYMAMELIFD
jgi:hypothetical protein